MTPIDRFERQLPAALTDLADPRTPDYVIDILGQTARTRQRPAWASLERWLHMDVPSTASTRHTRWRPLTLLAVIAGLALIALGAVALSGGSQRGTIKPPLASAAAELPAATIASPATASSAPGPIPAAIVGTWIAPVREVPGLFQAATSEITFDDLKDDVAAPGFSIALGARSFGQEARADEVEPGILRLVSRPSPGGCQDRDVGRYRWSMPADDRLVLELVSDQCAARSTITPGTWVRSGVGATDGGVGIAADFRPFFEFTLPAGTYRGRGNLHDAISIDGTDGSTFKAWKDVDGFVDACDDSKGRLDLDPGIDPFLAHLASSRGLAVGGTTETTIDGHRAVKVDLTTKSGLDPAGCFDGGVLQWVPHAWDAGEYHLGIGQRDTVLVTDVDGATIVFEILDGSGAVPQAVVDSIRFIDALPS